MVVEQKNVGEPEKLRKKRKGKAKTTKKRKRTDRRKRGRNTSPFLHFFLADNILQLLLIWEFSVNG